MMPCKPSACSAVSPGRFWWLVPLPCSGPPGSLPGSPETVPGFAFAALTGSLYLGAQFGVFLLLSVVGLRTNLKEQKAVSKLVENRKED